MGADEAFDLLNIEQLAETLGVPKNSVYKWNAEGTGPKRIRIGKKIFYKRSDVQAWIDAKVGI